jgi:hypothetical protein
MRENWLAEIYQNIKRARNERLSQAFSLLDKKAASDPEVAEAISLLRPWVTGQGQDDETTSNGT